MKECNKGIEEWMFTLLAAELKGLGWKTPSKIDFSTFENFDTELPTVEMGGITMTWDGKCYRVSSGKKFNLTVSFNTGREAAEYMAMLVDTFAEIGTNKSLMHVGAI